MNTKKLKFQLFKEQFSDEMFNIIDNNDKTFAVGLKNIGNNFVIVSLKKSGIRIKAKNYAETFPFKINGYYIENLILKLLMQGKGVKIVEPKKVKKVFDEVLFKENIRNDIMKKYNIHSMTIDTICPKKSNVNVRLDQMTSNIANKIIKYLNEYIKVLYKMGLKSPKRYIIIN